MSATVEARTLAGLRILAQKFGIKDIGISPEQREIYLLSGPRRLNAILNNHFFLGWQQREGHHPEKTWDRLDYVLLEILRETKIPQPGEVGPNGPWQEGWVEGEKRYVPGWSVIPIPEPGGPQFPWWSAKTGRLMPPVRVPTFSLCSEPPLDPAPHGNGPALLRLVNSDLPPVFVSHGINLESLRRAEKCGGLLWPSLAVTWKVPPRYGDIVLIADARLPTAYLPPSGRRDRRFIITASDSWSPAGGELLRLEKAINWELLGDRQWWAGDRKYEDGGYGQRSLQSELVLGSQDIDDMIGGFAPDIAKEPLKNMSQFWRRIKYLVKVHTQRSGVYEYEPREDLLKATDEHGDFYSYIELKVRGVLSLSSFVACLYPRRLERSATRFLDRLGFKGWRIPFRWDGPLEKDCAAEDPQRAAWALAATHALLKWADNPCSAPGVTVPEFIRTDLSSMNAYSPVAEYAPNTSSMDYNQFGGHVGFRAGYCRTPEEEDQS